MSKILNLDFNQRIDSQKLHTINELEEEDYSDLEEQKLLEGSQKRTVLSEVELMQSNIKEDNVQQMQSLVEENQSQALRISQLQADYQEAVQRLRRVEKENQELLREQQSKMKVSSSIELQDFQIIKYQQD